MIPKIIHQVYEDMNGPSKRLLKMSDTWIKLNPSWKYMFWNKESITLFLETYFPSFIDVYNSFKFNVQRWDAIRYLILYKFGGLYVDMDYQCLKPIDGLIDDKYSCYMGLEPEERANVFHKDLIVGNAFMASEPECIYFKNIIDDMIYNRYELFNHIKTLQVLETTGPFMTTRVYENLGEPIKKEINLIDPKLVMPLTKLEIHNAVKGYEVKDLEKRIDEAYALHYFLGSWVEQCN